MAAICPLHEDEESDSSSSAEEGAFLGLSASSVRDLSGDLKAKVIAFHDSHTYFFRNSSLAASIAVWITLSGLIVFDKSCHEWAFGIRGRFHAKAYEDAVDEYDRRAVQEYNVTDADLTKEQSVKLHGEVFGGLRVPCDPNSHGRTVDIAPLGWDQQLVPWNETLGPWNPEHNIRQVWCGYLEAGLEGLWPNVAQFIVFTVFASTGETVQLAWQGLMGTLCACANRWFMAMLYPDGARVKICDEASDTICHESNYSALVCWIDVVLVLFLFLISTANRNTIMFGMSWHVCFMMDFMNPAKGPNAGDVMIVRGVYLDDEVADVIATTLVGAAISILATFFPRMCFCRRPLLNKEWIKKEVVDVVEGINKIWKDSLDYYCGEKKSPTRFKLGRQITLMRQSINKLNAHISSAWWESCGCGNQELARHAMQFLGKSISEIDLSMYILSEALQHAIFSKKHVEFCSALKPKLEELQQLTGDVLVASAEYLADGKLSEVESGELRSKVDRLHESQQILAPVLLKADMEDAKEELTFVFGLSVVAQNVEETGRRVADPSALEVSEDWQTILKSGPREFFDPSRVTKADHVKFAIKNWMPITACFALGYFAPSYSVFTPYSATMANTLALLITRHSSSAIMKNLHRVLGVMLGKFYPILIGAFLYLLPCDTVFRTVIHSITLFGFVAVGTYVYYTSKTFGYMACLVTGFGVYPLMQPCQAHLENTFAARYKELGEVTMAILIQFVFEGTITLLAAETPKRLAIQKLREVSQSGQETLNALLDKSLPRMREQANRVCTGLNEAEELGDAADPKAQLAPLLDTPFRITLFKHAVEDWNSLSADLNLLVMACADSGQTFADNGVEENDSYMLDIFSGSENVRELINRVLTAMEHVNNGLMSLLEHSTETRLDLPNWRRESVSAQFDRKICNDLKVAIQKDPGSSHLSVRCAVALQTLDRMLARLLRMEENVITENVY